MHTSWLWNKHENVLKKFRCVCNLCVTKVDNNLKITSVRSSLDLGNKIWIGKPFMDIVFHFKNSRLRFFIFATRKLWNYLVQVFLVGFSSFLLSDYSSLINLLLMNHKLINSDWIVNDLIVHNLLINQYKINTEESIQKQLLAGVL